MTTSQGRNEHVLRTVRAQRQRRARRRWLGTCLALGLLIYVMVFGDAGWLAVRDAKDRVDDLRTELDELQTERAELEAATAELREPAGFELERTAREMYRMQRPGEEVHHLVGGDDSHASPEAP